MSLNLNEVKEQIVNTFKKNNQPRNYKKIAYELHLNKKLVLKVLHNNYEFINLNWSDVGCGKSTKCRVWRLK